MTYTSLDQLKARFGEQTLIQLTDRDPVPTGAIVMSAIEDALTGADAEINSSLAKRYRLPLAEVPPQVADLALVIAIYKLHVYAPDEKIVKDYERALVTLREIARGDKLLDLEGIEPTVSGAGGVVTSDRPRDLTPDNLHGFI